MSFYGVISALMFLGAVQQLLLAIEHWNIPHLLMSATLGAIVFNDAVYTAHVVEGEKTVKYKLPLMLDDLFNFCLLALAIVALNPTKNLFDVDLSGVFHFNSSEEIHWFAEAWYWLFLGVYWASIMYWTSRAGKYDAAHLRHLLLAEGKVTRTEVHRGADTPYPRTLWFAATAIVMMFMLEALLAASRWEVGRTARYVVALAYFLAYIALIRPPLLSRWKDQQLKAMTAD